MTSPNIRVDADVSGVKRAIDDVVNKVKEATEAGSDVGAVDVDTKPAQEAVNELRKEVDELKDSIADIGPEIDGVFGARLLQQLREAQDAAKRTGDALSDTAPAGALNGAADAAQRLGDALPGGDKAKAINEAADAAQRLGDALSDKGPAGAADAGASSMRKLAVETERARRVQEILAREGIRLNKEQTKAAVSRYDAWRSSNARGTRRLRDQPLDEYLDTGWRNASLQELDARRIRRDVLRAIGVRDGAPGPGGEPGTPPAEPPKPQRTLGAFVRDAASRGASSIAQAALPNGGAGGAIARGAVGEAAATPGGLLSSAGASRLALGGLIGGGVFAAIKAVQGVAGAVGDAEQEAIGYGDLSRQVGATAGEFDALRQQVRATTYGMGVTYNEAVKLAQGYAQASGLGPKGRDNLSGELRGAVEFSRGFGLDPARGAQFFGSMRRLGVSDGEASNRRLALMIADAMARKGDFARMGELADAVQQFATVSTMRAMAPANLEGFTEFVGRFSGLKVPGLGSAESAGLVAKLDHGYRGEGGGDAGQNFRMSVLQRQSKHVTAMDLRAVADGGFLATGESLFGRQSRAYAAAKALGGEGGQREMARLDALAKDFGGEAMGPREVRALIEHYRNNGGRTAAVSAISAKYGLSDPESNSLIEAVLKPGGMESMSGRLRRAGVDVGAIKPANIGLLASLSGADREGLEKQAQQLLARKGGDELKGKARQDLEKVLKGDGSEAGTEALRDAVLKLVAARDMPNKGDEVRDGLTSLQNVLQDFAGRLVPITSTIRDTLSAMALKAGVIDREQAWGGRGADARRDLEARLKDVTDPDERRAIVDAEIERAGKDQRLPPSYLDGLRQQRFGMVEGTGPASLDPSVATAVKPATYGKTSASKEQLVARPSQFDALFERVGKEAGVDPLLLKAIAVQESGLDPTAIGTNKHKDGSVSFDRGLMQLNSRYDRERGTEGNRAFDPETNARAAATYLRQLIDRRGGSIERAVVGYNGTGEKAEAYGQQVLGLYRRAQDAERDKQWSAAQREAWREDPAYQRSRVANGRQAKRLEPLGAPTVEETAASLQPKPVLDGDAAPPWEKSTPPRALGLRRRPEMLVPQSDPSAPAPGVPGRDAGMPAALPMLSQQRHVFEHRITLTDPRGRDIAPKVVTTSTAPTPAGSNR